MSPPIRVLLVDDQPLLLSGFSMILSTEDDIEVVGQVTDGRQAVEAVGRLRPDVVLMDVQMPVMDGIEATRTLVADGAGDQGPRVVILTTFDRDDYLFDALAAGASGFLLKNADPDDLIEAVRAVAGGHALLAPEVTRRVIARMAGAPDPQAEAGPTNPALAAKVDLLTERELETLRLIAEGLSNAEIAGRMFLGEATVKTHVSNVLSKLHLRDRVQAVVFAYDAGLAQPGEPTAGG